MSFDHEFFTIAIVSTKLYSQYFLSSNLVFLRSSQQLSRFSSKHSANYKLNFASLTNSLQFTEVLLIVITVSEQVFSC